MNGVCLSSSITISAVALAGAENDSKQTVACVSAPGKPRTGYTPVDAADKIVNIRRHASWLNPWQRRSLGTGQYRY